MVSLLHLSSIYPTCADSASLSPRACLDENLIHFSLVTGGGVGYNWDRAFWRREPSGVMVVG